MKKKFVGGGKLSRILTPDRRWRGMMLTFRKRGKKVEKRGNGRKRRKK